MAIRPKNVVDPTASPFILLPETSPLSRSPSPLPITFLASGHTSGAWRESSSYIILWLRLTISLSEPGAPRVFPNKIVNTVNNTVQACLKKCSDYGYPAGGLEYSEECYCGDVEDIAANGGVMRPESECNMLCNGDPYHLCGGQERLQLYEWNGSLNVWHEPTNTGRYEFLISSPVVPLITTLGINNKVTFVEKFGTSIYPNSTGAYELDLTLVDDYTKTWREMHVKSDVFCAASIVLPDKAGRQMTIGGWSVDSLYGVRLYSPDGSAGVNGTNDWEEDIQILALQRGRWYPTSLVLANGSILVVGGEHGSNGAPEPSLEILPKPEGGDTVIDVDWLERTDPNNLYPFLYVLPTNGDIFVSKCTHTSHHGFDLTLANRLLERGPYLGQGHFPNDQGFTQPPWNSAQRYRWPYIPPCWRIYASPSILPLH